MFDPQAGPIILQGASAAGGRTAPDQKPEGTNVQWIPGYWSWDDERKDYLWVSGFKRDVPR